MNMKELNIPSVTKSIVQHLRINIIEGKLAPGQKLNEIELAEQLGVSRPPLREAFRILENEHLVFSLPRKGCYVSDVSIDDCHQIYELREFLEFGAIDCLKERSIREIPEVSWALQLSSKGLSIPADTSEFELVGFQNSFPIFHLKLIKSTKNEWLIRSYNMIVSNLARYQYICYANIISGNTQKEHEQISDLIESGDYEMAKETLRSHIRSFLSPIEKVMAKKDKIRAKQHEKMEMAKDT